MRVAELTDRARSLQQAFDGFAIQILDTVETPDRIIVAVLIGRRHVGPSVSPVGGGRADGRETEVRTIERLTVRAGVLSATWLIRGA